jgi:hypothetical protein
MEGRHRFARRPLSLQRFKQEFPNPPLASIGSDSNKGRVSGRGGNDRGFATGAEALDDRGADRGGGSAERPSRTERWSKATLDSMDRMDLCIYMDRIG